MRVFAMHHDCRNALQAQLKDNRDDFNIRLRLSRLNHIKCDKTLCIPLLSSQFGIFPRYFETFHKQ